MTRWMIILPCACLLYLASPRAANAQADVWLVAGPRLTGGLSIPGTANPAAPVDVVYTETPDFPWVDFGADVRVPLGSSWAIGILGTFSSTKVEVRSTDVAVVSPITGVSTGIVATSGLLVTRSLPAGGGWAVDLSAGPGLVFRTGGAFSGFSRGPDASLTVGGSARIPGGGVRFRIGAYGTYYSLNPSGSSSLVAESKSVFDIVFLVGIQL